MSLVSVADLEVRYGADRAVHGLDFEISAGRAVCLLGPNGAGKTSTLLATTGLVEPHAGTITVAGENATRRDARWFVEHGVVLVPEGARNFSSLTVLENLELPSKVLGRRRTKGNIDDVFELFPVLAERRRQHAGLLSGGEQKMLAIGRGLMIDPVVMCVDEPALGLAPVVINRILQALAALMRRGIGIAVSEQSLAFVEELGGDVLVIERGLCTWRGVAEGLSNIPAVAEALIGRGTRALPGV
jgi:branched-chain amino acid transport system ATP-binding protein